MSEPEPTQLDRIERKLDILTQALADLLQATASPGAVRTMSEQDLARERLRDFVRDSFARGGLAAKDRPRKS